ncbi:MAG: diguanylate cyclase, partial [Agathobacter sp.]|nr:diguanylate cyclase [Agathobacter sp.]
MRGNVSTVDYDQLTGLLNHNAFCRGIEEIIDDHEEEIAQGKYALIYFDILRFKAVNDMFGMQEGDALLVHVANVIRKY